MNIRIVSAIALSLLASPAVYAVTMVNADFSAVRVFPNPWRSDQHQGRNVVLDHLPEGSNVKIFTVSGHLVKSLTPAANSVSWDLTNNKGEIVASGVYLYLIKAGDQTNKGKLILIK
jgi:hypothetical protein